MAVSFDFFNRMPLALLPTILSFLPFKDAVRTTAVSKKWLNMCKSTTNVEFDELFFIRIDQPDEIREVQRRAFLDFIKSWIANHEGSEVNKFSLKISWPEKVGEIIDQCVNFAIQRGVKELTLDFANAYWKENMNYMKDYFAQMKLPTLVYNHNSLEFLKLYSCSFDENRMLNFHALKEVSLGWMELSLSAIKALLSNCNMLESLILFKCWSEEVFDLGEEDHMRLRKLVLDMCCFDLKIFRVNAPNIKIFKYRGRMDFCSPEIQPLPWEEVDLDFSVDHRFRELGHPLCTLVKAIPTTKVLTVCKFVLQAITRVPKHLPNMDVRHLIVKTSLNKDEFIGITFFLNICPVLERLTIELCEVEDHYIECWARIQDEEDCQKEKKGWMHFAIVRTIMRSSLKVLEVNGFRGMGNEYTVLEYLINYGFALEKLSINMFKDASGSVEPHFLKYAENLLTVPRASKNLEISIS